MHLKIYFALALYLTFMLQFLLYAKNDIPSLIKVAYNPAPLSDKNAQNDYQTLIKANFVQNNFFLQNEIKIK